METIVLAGGMGTRLRSVISDIPKTMAPIGNRPFLAYILDYLSQYPIDKVVLSVGYKGEKIEQYFGKQYKNILLSYSIENEPLGTGGAIKKALEKVSQETFFILNGDTFFNVDLYKLLKRHIDQKFDLTMTLKPLSNFERYGSVAFDKSGRIRQFQEKRFCKFGYINGGVYLANANVFTDIKLPGKFSFENDFLERYIDLYNIGTYLSNEYFIDIGVPEDYARAQMEL